MQLPRISIVPGAGSSELPFVIGVMADLTGMPLEPLPRLRDRRFVEVDRENLDDVLNACRPHLAFGVENKLSEDPNAGNLKIDLCFRCLEDFSPERLLGQVKPLRELMELRRHLAELNASLRNQDELGERLKAVVTDPEALEQMRRELGEDGEALPPPPPPAPPMRRNWVQAAPPAPEPGVWTRGRAAGDPSLLDQLAESFRPPTAEHRERARDHVKHFMKEVLTGSVAISRDVESEINSRIHQIECLVSIQLNEVLHHPAFQKLEATWRGLHFLLRRVRKAESVKVRVLNISKKELAQQFDKARERHGSAVARKLSNGRPYALLIGDYEFGPNPGDCNLMRFGLSRMAAYLNAPFLAAAAPGMAGVESFLQLAERDLDPFNWIDVRQRLEARYLGLVLPRFLLRAPYTRENSPKEFAFEEGVDGTDHSRYLWGNAVWALAAHFAITVHTYGWLGAAREAGHFTGLPVTTHRADEGDIVSRGPTELAIPDRLYNWIRENGFIPFCSIEGTDAATFHETWSVHRPLVDPDDDPPTTYDSAQIDCMIDLCRIVHCIRAFLRRERQSFETAQACEDRLSSWIGEYVAPAYARRTAECAWPLLAAQLRVATTTDGKATVHAALLPYRAAGALSHPVEFEVPIVLPWALTQPPAPVPAAVIAEPEETTGRDRFLRRIQQAEAAIQLRKFEVAILILEELVGTIDRHHLEEWESPHLITRVWDLLRRCYLFTGGDSDERPRALLGRICRLDPTRAIE